MKRRLLVIALDAAEPRLLDDWIARGELPALGRLMAEGFSCPVTNLPGFGNGVFWPCLHTGVNPARHGRFFYDQIEPGTYRFRRFDERRDFLTPSIWEQADQAGTRSAILDCERAPSRPLRNGRIVTGWLAHDRASELHSYPPGWAREIVERFGADPWHGDADRVRVRGASLADMVGQSLGRIEARTRLTAELLSSDRYDAVVTTYSDAHDLGHLCWHLHDPDHPLHDPAERERLGDPLLTVYKALDRAVAELCALAPGQDVVVAGGPGMTLHFFANRFVDPFLRRIEFGAQYGDGLALEGFDRLLAALPWRIRSRIARWSDSRYGDEFAADRKRRRYFAVPHNDNSAGIRVNLAGREPHGTVQPGAEFEAVLAELDREFRTLRNADTGIPLVADVVHVGRLLRGPGLDRLPDLLVVWNRAGKLDAVESPRAGLLRDLQRHRRTGDHTPDGFLFASGPRVRPGRHSVSRTPMDVGATLATLLGLPGGDLDGTTIADFLAV